MTHFTPEALKLISEIWERAALGAMLLNRPWGRIK